MRVGRGLGLATILLAAVSSVAVAQDSMPEGDWRTINRDAKATRFSPLDDINRSNVAELQPAWEYAFRAFNTAVPLVIDGTMFIPAGNRVVALPADNFSVSGDALVSAMSRAEVRKEAREQPSR